MFFEERRTSLNIQTNKRMTLKPEMISGVFLGTTFIVITVNQELHSSCRKKGHSFLHSSVLTLSGGQKRRWVYFLVSRTDDYRNVDGDRELPVPWTGFTQFTKLIEKPP